MGNTINVKPIEEVGMFEITEKLIRDFQYHINLVDRSMVSFVRSIDSMRASCTILNKDKKEADGTDVSYGKRLIGEPEAALLLETIDEVVSDHKFIAMESLSSLFTLLINMGRIYFTSESETTLSLDKYRRQNSALTDMNIRYCDSRIESLQSKIKSLGVDYEHLKEDLNNFNEREILYHKEKNILKNHIEDLENDLSKTKSEKGDAIKQNGDMERKNEELTRQIGLLKLKEERMANEIRADISRREKTEEETKIQIKKYEEKIATLDQQLREGKSTAEELQSEKMAKMSEIEERETELKTLKDENTKLRSDLSDEQNANASLKKENISINMLSDGVNKMNTSLKEYYDKEIRRLTACLQTETVEKAKYSTNVGDLINEQHRFDEEKNLLETKLNQLKEENQQLTLDLNETESAIKTLKKEHKDEIDRRLLKIEKLKTEKKEQERKIDEINTSLTEMNITNSSLITELQKEMNMRVSVLEEKTAIINSLNDEIATMNKKSEEINQLNEEEKDSLKESLEQEKNKGKDYEEQLRKLKEKQQKDSEEIIQLSSEKTSLTNVVKEIQLRLELATKNVIHVQVYYTTEFRAFPQDTELQQVLKTRMEADCIELQFLNCSQPFCTISTELPLLIVCCRPSRTNRDRYISNVLEGTKVTPKTALLIFHDRDKKDFVKDMVSVKDTAQARNVAGIFDIGYTKGELHKCDINSKNVERLFSFINREGVLKSNSTESAM